MVSFGMHAHLP